MTTALRRAIGVAVALLALPAAALDRPDGPPPPLADRALLPSATRAAPELSATDILARAHAAAGGDAWVRPKAVKFTGYNIIHRPEGEILWDHYTMWREYAGAKADSHAADGRVRIEAWSGERLALLLAFDGVDTYNQTGKVDPGAAAAEWSSNFGFGAIRNALDPGWTQERLPDDLVEGEPAFMIRLTDPSGGKTLFGIRQSDFAILSVGFDTARGWHERRYSHFFTVPGSTWVQPGRVRLLYDGVKANEAIWTGVAFAERFPDDLFRIEAAPTAPTP